jgi:nucleoid-associated protein YgaU
MNPDKPDFSDVKGRGSSTAPKPDFSDVKCGGSSTAPSPAGARTYRVAAGDNLSRIAKKLDGNANKRRRIYEANKDIIKNPGPDPQDPGRLGKEGDSCTERAF